MEKAFLEEFRQWWPFAKKKLAEGGWVTFAITLEVKGRDGYFVQGSLDSSDKVKLNGPGSN